MERRVLLVSEYGQSRWQRGSGGQERAGLADGAWHRFQAESSLCANSRSGQQTEPSSYLSAAHIPSQAGLPPCVPRRHDPTRCCILLMAPAISCLWRRPLVQPRCLLLDIFCVVQVHLCMALSPSCEYWSLSLAVVLLEGNLRRGKLIQGLHLKSSASHPLAQYQSVQNHKSWGTLASQRQVRTNSKKANQRRRRSRELSAVPRDLESRRQIRCPTLLSRGGSGKPSFRLTCEGQTSSPTEGGGAAGMAAHPPSPHRQDRSCPTSPARQRRTAWLSSVLLPSFLLPCS